MAKPTSLLATLAFLALITGCGKATPIAEPATPAPTLAPSTAAPIKPTVTASVSVTRARSADGMVLIPVPGGTFQMGSTSSEVDDAIALCREHYSICNNWYYMREHPQHTVTLDSFWIDQTEVSNAQYHQCVQAGSCPEPSTCKKGVPTYADPEKTDHPVVCISWDEAQNYCQWAGGRLPTEAEWEYAFRGEAGSIYPWGDEFDGSKLNYCDKNCSQPHADDRFDDGYALSAPVGSYPQGTSWSGVLDMGGNVTEWVADWLGDYSAEAVANPSGPSTGDEKMVKGCSWFFHPTYCRGALRGSIDPETRFDYLGFRCVVPGKQETEGGADKSLNSVLVPLGNPPTIDGMLSPGEWADAVVETFADGSELLLMNEGKYLYLGIRSNTPGMIAGNVFIKNRDEISIMHSSAALGTAIYQKGEDSWHQTQDFIWRCRDTSNSETAQEERNAFLQEEGWVAFNSRMGTPEELEYQIEVTGDPVQLAANFIRATNPSEKIPWPAELDDDCIRPTPGELPENLFFSPEQWGTLELSRWPGHN